MGAAALGGVAYGAGNVTSGIGQGQGLSAMRDVWNEQGQHQADADAQIRNLIEGLLTRVGVQANANEPEAAALRAKLDTVARNTTAGAKANLAKRGGRLGAEERARTGRAYTDAGNGGQRLADFLSRLQGYRQGAQNVDQAGRQFSLDRGRVVSDARDWQGLAPLQIQTAGMAGAPARITGTQLQALGQSMIYSGMSQPKTGQAGTPGLNGGLDPVTGYPTAGGAGASMGSGGYGWGG